MTLKLWIRYHHTVIGHQKCSATDTHYSLLCIAKHVKSNRKFVWWQLTDICFFVLLFLGQLPLSCAALGNEPYRPYKKNPNTPERETSTWFTLWSLDGFLQYSLAYSSEGGKKSSFFFFPHQTKISNLITMVYIGAATVRLVGPSYGGTGHWGWGRGLGWPPGKL